MNEILDSSKALYQMDKIMLNIMNSSSDEIKNTKIDFLIKYLKSYNMVNGQRQLHLLSDIVTNLTESLEILKSDNSKHVDFSKYVEDKNFQECIYTYYFNTLKSLSGWYLFISEKYICRQYLYIFIYKWYYQINHQSKKI